MRNLVKIENMNGLARDTSSHAVISTSDEVFNDYHKRKSLASKQQEEINAMKQDIGEIKSMLQALIQR
jgi:hypothetical protein